MADTHALVQAEEVARRRCRAHDGVIGARLAARAVMTTAGVGRHWELLQ